LFFFIFFINNVFFLFSFLFFLLRAEIKHTIQVRIFHSFFIFFFSLFLFKFLFLIIL
jgi:hypothetical protein